MRRKFLVLKKFPTSAWRPSMFSTKKSPRPLTLNSCMAAATVVTVAVMVAVMVAEAAAMVAVVMAATVATVVVVGGVGVGAAASASGLGVWVAAVAGPGAAIGGGGMVVACGAVTNALMTAHCQQRREAAGIVEKVKKPRWRLNTGASEGQTGWLTHAKCTSSEATPDGLTQRGRRAGFSLIFTWRGVW